MLDPEKERQKEALQTIELPVSNELALALFRAEELLPEHRQQVQVADLLAGILTETETDNRGQKILSRASSGRSRNILDRLSVIQEETLAHQSQVFIRYGQRSIPCSSSVVSLLENASGQTQNEYVSTDDIVMAEAHGVSSIVRTILGQSGSSLSIDSGILSVLSNHQRLLDFQEERAELSITYQEPFSLASRKDVQISDRMVDKSARTEVEAGRHETAVLRPKWTESLLHSILTQRISVLVTDRHEEAERVVLGLAQQLDDDEGLFPISDITLVSRANLVRDPNLTIRNLLMSDPRGVFFIPDFEHCYDNSDTLRNALVAGNQRLITRMSQKQWDKGAGKYPFEDIKPILVEAPDVTETIEILNSRKQAFEAELSAKNLQITISDEVLETAARLADQYYRESPPPQGAKDLLYRAVTAVKMAAIQEGNLDQEVTITPENIRLALWLLTGIEDSTNDPEKYLGMEEALKQRIIGQDEAVDAVTRSVIRAKSGLKDPKKPVGSFIFLGPSGVGKTELAKSLAEFLFGDEEELIRIDMGEYQERHSVAKLIGAPPGYVGYEEGGQLTEAVRKKPYSVVVFDEYEKAHPEVLNALLPLLDEGHMTDGKGRTINFGNTVIIMTGNLGSGNFRREQELGRERVVASVMEELERRNSPEFLNRPDDIIVFNSLSPDSVAKIADFKVRKLNKSLSQSGIRVELTEEAKQFLANVGYNPAYGARPLNRAIDTHIKDPLAIEILREGYSKGTDLLVDVKDGQMVFTKIEEVEE